VGKRRAQRPLSEARTMNALQRGALAPPPAKPPTDGITSSAESLGQQINAAHATVAVFIENRARTIADLYRVPTASVIAEIVKRLKGG
jgi:hypothetical protein